jgi:hypothetical protein
MSSSDFPFSGDSSNATSGSRKSSIGISELTLITSQLNASGFRAESHRSTYLEASGAVTLNSVDDDTGTDTICHS